MSKAKTKNMIVKDVGAIKELIVPVPEEGGVVIARGPNGCGKSTLLRAAQGLLGDKKDKASLRHHDDAEKGFISLGDATLTLGRSNRSSGALDIHSLAGRVDLGDIVDPQVEDPLRADKRRIEAIFKVAGSSMEGTELKKLLPADVVESLDWKDSAGEEPILDVADRLRSVLTERARNLEKKGQERAAQAKAMKIGKHEAFTCPTAEEIQQAKDDFQAKTEEGIKLAERKRLADEQFDRVAKARREFAEADGQDLQSKIDSLEADIKEAYGKFEQFGAEISKHEKAILELRDARNKAGADCEALEVKKDALHKQLKYREQLEAIIAESVQPITEEQVNQHRAAVDEARTLWDELRQAEQDAKTLEKANAIEKEAETIEADSKKAREVAGKGIDSALGKLIGKVFPGSQFLEGRLAVEHPKRGTTYFGELSDGERWTVVLNLATSLCPDSTMLVVPQIAWEGLDGANRQKINDWAKEHKIVVLTAESSKEVEAEGIEATVLD